MSLLSQHSYTLLSSLALLLVFLPLFFLKQLEPRAFPAVSKKAGRTGEEVKHLGEPEEGVLDWGVQRPCTLSPDSFIF